jgi:hypothetical protein
VRKTPAPLAVNEEYLALYFFTELPREGDLRKSFEQYEKHSKHGIRSASLYRSMSGMSPARALLVASGGHHLEPLLATPAGWTARPDIVLGVQVASLARGISLSNRPERMTKVRLVRWPLAAARLREELSVSFLVLASATHLRSRGLLWLDPGHESATAPTEGELFKWSWSWVPQVSSLVGRASVAKRRGYDAILAQLTETYRSDVAYLLLRVMYVRNMLETGSRSPGLPKLLVVRGLGVLRALEESLQRLQRRYSNVANAVTKNRDALAEVDGALEVTEAGARALTVLEETLSKRISLEPGWAAVSRAVDSGLDAIALKGLDNVLLDVAAGLRGERMRDALFVKAPARVASSGQVFRAVHEEILPLVGLYKHVEWYDHVEPSNRYTDLSHHGMVECYEVPARLLLRAGSWPLVARQVVETGLGRLTELGEFQATRVVLGLIQWWSERRGVRVRDDLARVIAEWPKRPPAQSLPEGMIELIVTPTRLMGQLTEQSEGECQLARRMLCDVICTRIVGPAYVLALARFGLRGALAQFGGFEEVFYGLERHAALSGAGSRNSAGGLGDPREILAVCLATLAAGGVDIPEMSDLWSPRYSLGQLESSILKSIDNLAVRKPYDSASHREALAHVSALSRGVFVTARPIMLLNALWSAALEQKGYLNEVALFVSLMEARSRGRQRVDGTTQKKSP